MKKAALIFVLFPFVKSSHGQTDASRVDGISGATPLAVARSVPPNLLLTIVGEVNQEYRFDSAALGAFATTRTRTREVTDDREYIGAYAYIGIPVIHILEGVKPKKKTGDFDRPLDMIVTITNSREKKARFSYSEICMADDAYPITLAFFREPVLPSKAPETYKGNKFTGNVEGLRLICPADADIERYLDDVKTITLHTPVLSYEDLPAPQRNFRCSSDSLRRCTAGNCTQALMEGMETATVTDWVRVGHGMGYKGISSASGYRLDSFLKKNFPGDNEGYFYLFIACDGYRSLFSGAEIFKTAAGGEIMIITEMDGERPSGGLTLGPVWDYFVDRDVWGLSHVVQLKP